MLLLGDVHGLDDEQVVVEAHHGVDKGDEHHEVGPERGALVTADGCHEDKELREHTGKRGDASQREEGERHEQRQLRVGLVEAVVGRHLGVATVVLYRADDGEDGQVGGHVDQHVEGEGCDAHCAVAHYGEHDVACLRDGREGHEALQLRLADGEEVAHGDGEHDDNPEQRLPYVGHCAEDLHQDDGQGERGGTLGDDAQITGDGRGGTLVGVGSPEVEGHERNLEAQSAEEEHQSHDEHCALTPEGGALVGNDGGHIVEVECAADAVEHGDAVEHHAAGECGGEDVLGGSLGRLVLVFVEGHEAGHGHGCHLQSEEEQEEVAAGHHDVHAEQGAQDEHVVFANEFTGGAFEPLL